MVRCLGRHGHREGGRSGRGPAPDVSPDAADPEQVVGGDGRAEGGEERAVERACDRDFSEEKTKLVHG